MKNTIISNNRSSKNSNTEIEIAKENYIELEEKLRELYSKEEILSKELQNVSNELEDLQQNQVKLDDEFRKKGGILAEERDSLNSRIIELESRRSVINQNIKDFCNEILPFLIVKSNLINLENQLKTENDSVLYNHLKDKLNIDYIRNILLGKIDDSILDSIAMTVSDSLVEDIKPDGYKDNFNFIYNLSNDENNTLTALIRNLLNTNSQPTLDLFEELRCIAGELSDIRRKLNTSLEDNSLNDYLKSLSDLTTKIAKLSENKTLLNGKFETLTDKINTTTVERDKSKAKYTELLQANKVMDMSDNLILMLDDIISTLTDNKIKEIQNNFMNIFKKIIRKDNFIDFINIDDKFNVSLYINKIYSSLEIENLISNIGYDEMEKKFGELFFQDLFKAYKVETKSEFLNAINSNNQSAFLDLRTKVDINGFSSGEKQIYILCLYWALIKSSDIEIPFIIDTPYARIDETHRNNITSEYLSSISNQVIILSTNTEIDEKAYIEIKPKLNGEYLIEYDDKNRKTIQTKGYFFEV